MVMKGEVQPDHTPMNFYDLIVSGMSPIYVVTVSGLDYLMDRIDLPDRTAASGGEPGTVEFDIEVMAHHSAEMAALEAWFKEGQHPCTPGYKKIATLILKRNSGVVGRSYELSGLFTLGREIPGLDKANEGEAIKVTWHMSADAVEMTA